MKPHLGVRVLLGVSALTIAGYAQALGFGQADQPELPSGGPQSIYLCQGQIGVTKQFFDIPTLTVQLATTGNPVRVTIHATANMNPDTYRVMFRPTIDNRAFDAKHVEVTNIKPQASMNLSMSMSRVYNVPSGMHTFKAQVSCDFVTSVQVLGGWITVEELAGNNGNSKNNATMSSPFSK